MGLQTKETSTPLSELVHYLVNTFGLSQGCDSGVQLFLLLLRARTPPTFTPVL